jgi:hypothetical protein
MLFALSMLMPVGLLKTLFPSMRLPKDEDGT